MGTPGGVGTPGEVGPGKALSAMLSAALDLENDPSIPLTSDPSFASAIPRFLGQERWGGGEKGAGVPLGLPPYTVSLL